MRLRRIVIKNSMSFGHPAERLDHYAVLGEDSRQGQTFRLTWQITQMKTVNFREAHDR